MNAFEPTMDWIPPCFTIPKILKEIIQAGNLPSDVLHQIVIPRNDKYSGKINYDNYFFYVYNALQAIKTFCMLSPNFSIHSGPLCHLNFLIRLYLKLLHHIDPSQVRSSSWALLLGS